MGVLQHWHLCLHPLRRLPSCHGRAHLEDQAPEARPLGGQPAGAHARGGQHAGEDELRAQRAGLLSSARSERPAVSGKRRAQCAPMATRREHPATIPVQRYRATSPTTGIKCMIVCVCVCVCVCYRRDWLQQPQRVRVTITASDISASFIHAFRGASRRIPFINVHTHTVCDLSHLINNR